MPAPSLILSTDLDRFWLNKVQFRSPEAPEPPGAPSEGNPPGAPSEGNFPGAPSEPLPRVIFVVAPEPLPRVIFRAMERVAPSEGSFPDNSFGRRPTTLALACLERLFLGVIT